MMGVQAASAQLFSDFCLNDHVPSDYGDKGERGQLADAREGHKPAAGRRGPRQHRMSESIAATAAITVLRVAIPAWRRRDPQPLRSL
jgi:hypothetical protein